MPRGGGGVGEGNSMEVGGGGVLSENPSVVRVWIFFSGTTQSIIVRSKGAHNSQQITT